LAGPVWLLFGRLPVLALAALGMLLVVVVVAQLPDEHVGALDVAPQAARATRFFVGMPYTGLGCFDW